MSRELLVAFCEAGIVSGDSVNAQFQNSLHRGMDWRQAGDGLADTALFIASSLVLGGALRQPCIDSRPQNLVCLASGKHRDVSTGELKEFLVCAANRCHNALGGKRRDNVVL